MFGRCMQHFEEELFPVTLKHVMACFQVIVGGNLSISITITVSNQ